MRIDLNADLGENGPADADLLTVVTSANIACGGHTGDAASMLRACHQAAAGGVAIGAHPAYPDREGFGRRPMTIEAGALAASLGHQLHDLLAAAAQARVPVSYLKPHGALYHAVLVNPEHARVVADLAAEHDLPLLLPPHAPATVIGPLAAAAGVRLAAEGFVDRAYTPAGDLLDRGEPGAVLTDPDLVLAQAVQIATTGTVTPVAGTAAGGTAPIELGVESLCIHGDTPGAVDLARSVRAALLDAGVEVAPWSRA